MRKQIAITNQQKKSHQLTTLDPIEKYDLFPNNANQTGCKSDYIFSLLKHPHKRETLAHPRL